MDRGARLGIESGNDLLLCQGARRDQVENGH